MRRHEPAYPLSLLRSLVQEEVELQLELVHPELVDLAPPPPLARVEAEAVAVPVQPLDKGFPRTFVRNRRRTGPRRSPESPTTGNCHSDSVMLSTMACCRILFATMMFSFSGHSAACSVLEPNLFRPLSCS